MAFNSLEFIFIFLPLFLATFYLCSKFKKNYINKLILVIASMVFIGMFGIQHLIFIVFSVVINYFFSWLLKRQTNAKNKKLILVLTIVINVLMLLISKYLNFFYSSIVQLFNGEIKIFNLLVPLGISYITFQQIAYIVDIYKGEYCEHSFLDYAVFVLFFPKIVCGPIIFQKDFMPQLKNDDTYHVNSDNLFRGLYTFIIGLAKKVLIADSLAGMVNLGFGQILSLSSFDALIVMLSYTMQIYFDFSGYCDMACGVAQMFNLKIINNFEDPYQSYSILEFWKSWHISLTTFLRNYIYFPLGGSKKGKFRTFFNILVIFLISGFWHGASWTFVVWGAVHGVFNIIMRICSKAWDKLHSAFRWLINFTFINFTWLIFRANSLKDVVNFIARLFVFDFSFNFMISDLFVLMAAFVIVLGFKSITNKEFKINWQRVLIGTVLLVVSILYFSADGITFLYANF